MNNAPEIAAALHDMSAALQRLAYAIDSPSEPAEPEPEPEPDSADVLLPMIEGSLEAGKPGKVATLHAAEGDKIAIDQPLITVETDAMMIDIPSPYAGTVRWVTELEPGAEILVGDQVASIEPEEAPA